LLLKLNYRLIGRSRQERKERKIWITGVNPLLQPRLMVYSGCIMVFEALLGITLPILAGYILRKLRYFSEDHAGSLRLFVIRISIPSMVFTKLYQSDFQTLGQFLPLTLALGLFTVLAWIFSFFITRIGMWKEKQMENIQMIVFSNIGFIGWAVLFSALGEEGLTRGIIYSTFFWVNQYLFGFLNYRLTVQTSQKKQKLDGLLPSILPVFVSVLLGILLNLLKREVPGVLFEFLDKFGRMTVPLILFSLGMSVSLERSFARIKELLPLVLFRHVIIAAATVLTLLLIPGLDELSRQVVIIESFMPIAAGVLVIGDVFKRDMEYLSSGVALSTILSFVTIPLILFFWS